MTICPKMHRNEISPYLSFATVNRGHLTTYQVLRGSKSNKTLTLAFSDTPWTNHCNSVWSRNFRISCKDPAQCCLVEVFFVECSKELMERLCDLKLIKPYLLFAVHVVISFLGLRQYWRFGE